MNFAAYRKAGSTNRRSVQLQRPGARKFAQGTVAEREKGKTKEKTNLTPKQRKEPYKLCDELIKRFCENLRTNPGIPVEAICDSVGIARQTFYAWLDQGKKEPGGLHAKFAQEVTKALGDSWKLLHEMAIKAKPEQILFRRYANFYPAQRLEADLTSAGMPFLPQTFSVVLELNGPADEQEFEVQHNGDVG